MCQFLRKISIVKQVLAVRPSPVTDNLRWRYHSISANEMLLLTCLTAETVLTIHTLIWNWLIINPTSHYDEIPLNQIISWMLRGAIGYITLKGYTWKHFTLKNAI